MAAMARSACSGVAAFKRSTQKAGTTCHESPKRSFSHIHCDS
jgi:hypothetical protein